MYVEQRIGRGWSPKRLFMGLILLLLSTLGFSQEISQDLLLSSVSNASEKLDELLVKVKRINRQIDQEKRQGAWMDGVPDVVLGIARELKELETSLSESSSQLSHTVLIVKSQTLTTEEKAALMQLVETLRSSLLEDGNRLRLFIDKLDESISTSSTKFSI